MNSIKSKILLVLTLTALLTLGLAGCNKDDTDNRNTLKTLYKTYKNGSIDQCKYNGQTVFCAEQNVYDASSTVYDNNGKQIGTCNYAWGQLDEICGKLEDCETVYRVKDNIWGQPAVDKYGLGK